VRAEAGSGRVPSTGAASSCRPAAGRGPSAANRAGVIGVVHAAILMEISHACPDRQFGAAQASGFSQLSGGHRPSSAFVSLRVSP
jgi:hypothetical protein